jgi:ELWxxDGT repeat protein
VFTDRSFRLRRAHAAPRIRACEPLERRVLLTVGPPALVTDINTTGVSSFPSALVRLGDRILFRADDGYHGREWFATDGSAAGTTLLADIFPGPTGSAPPVVSGQDDPYAVVGGTLLFAANDSSHGMELWKTDGTPQGTSLVKDIRPGIPGSSPNNFAVVGNVLYFVADDGSHGRELWKSDGTEAGTQLVADLAPGSGASNPVPLAAVGGKLLMVVGGAKGSEPWTSDGTAEGTTLLKDINPGGVTSNSNPGIDLQTSALPTNARQVATAGGYVYFAATDAAHGRELWRTDGTADGTVLVADVLAGAASSEPRDLTAVGDTVYFVAAATASPKTYAIFRTDPAAPGGASLVNALQGIGDGMPVLGTAGGKLFAVARVPSTSQLGIMGLFTHDPATPAGTPLILLRNTGNYLPLQQRLLGDGARYIADYNGDAYLATLRAGDTGTVELIRSDGTPQGTVALSSWLLRTGDSTGQDPTLFAAPFRVVAGPNGVYVPGYDAQAGAELWRSDGTAFGTARVADVNTTTLGSGAGPVVAFNGRGLFYASSPGRGSELWSTDGTAGGTLLVKDINAGSFGSLWVLPPQMVPFNGRLYFPADDGTHHLELWSTDGTPAGTSLLKDIHPTDGSYPTELTPFRGRLWFEAEDPVNGGRLWSTDGTEQGTVMLDDAPSAPLPGYESPSMLTVVGDTLYFVADQARTGRELWKTDGTPQGTVLVRDLTPAADPQETDSFVYPSAMTALGNTLYFTTNGTLWRSDGTSDGTAAVKALPGDAWELTSAGGRLLFRAPRTPGGTDDTVWVSDGTAGGTVPLQDVTPAAADLRTPVGLKPDPAHAAAWFFDRPNSTTWRLWRTDGTQQGTVVVKSLPIGPATQTAGDTPAVLGFAGGLLYFRATGPAGAELWQSDGTDAGTTPVADINPGAGGSVPVNFGVAGGRAYFTANDGTHGSELWSIPLQPVVAGRYVFSNNSTFDGRRPAADAGDDAAIVSDKRPLLPGFGASGANVTGSTRGLNGLMVDVAGLPAGADPTADDFSFRWRAAGASAWAAAPAPAWVTVRRGAGSSGSDRVTLTWGDGVLADGWLEVTVKADDRTGLSRPDTFVLGNLRGDTGNDAGAPRVDAADLARTRAAIGTRAGPASPFDHNRDGRVDSLDLAIVRRALFNTLAPIEWPPPPAAQSLSSGPSRRAGVARRLAYDVL